MPEEREIIPWLEEQAALARRMIELTPEPIREICLTDVRVTLSDREPSD